MSAGERRGIACAGNWILDIVHDIPAWPAKSDLVQITKQVSGLGGGPANVASGLMAMGANYPVVPVGLVGARSLGDEMLALTQEAGLDTARIGRTSAATTSQTHVMNVPGDSRTFFHHTGANDLLDAQMIDVAGLAGMGLKIFYLGYLNLLATLDAPGPDGRPRAASVLGDARSRGMITCVDLVSSQSSGFRDTVFGCLPEIDYLFLNETEAARATGLRVDAPEDEPGMIAAARALSEGGVLRAVILHSPARTIWLEHGVAQVFAPAPLPPEKIVSSVGAGDALATGIIHGLHMGWTREAAVELGFRAAAACLGTQTATGGLGPELLSGS
ncbi:carbohydrate kinase family protein [Paracoccus aurantiacus]|uniref:Carbohydrate kinase family protein n=1 Tax=Paracoccus aurantiacus TaxID=2599412 RepID=A0A5C6RUN3_9RHOB|nr:carbohydrate kinase family protein [Paracoccus aurantiacus]TXB65639.1 carbohydrate kinase family protein [Paracoccus aurantiacus]